MTTTGIAILFDVARTGYDPEEVFNVLRDRIADKVWNFLPGVFVLRTDMKPHEVHEAIKNDKFRYLVLSFDPADINGDLTEAAWDSWFLDVFYADVGRICKKNGWDAKILAGVKQRRLEHQPPNESNA